FHPPVRFFLARLRGAAVGCGGVFLFPDFAEVKRMYVRHTARGQGVADAILASIEAEVCRAGLTVLRLETGDRQIAAMRLYVRMGFRECTAFGAYARIVANAIPRISGVRRIRADGAASHREQCVLREADRRVAGPA